MNYIFIYLEKELNMDNCLTFLFFIPVRRSLKLRRIGSKSLICEHCCYLKNGSNTIQRYALSFPLYDLGGFYIVSFIFCYSPFGRCCHRPIPPLVGVVTDQLLSILGLSNKLCSVLLLFLVVINARYWDSSVVPS